MSANADLITVETCVHVLLFEGPLGGGPSVIRLNLFCFQLSSHPCICTCEIRRQSDKNLLSSNPKYKNKNNYFVFEGPGGGALHQT